MDKEQYKMGIDKANGKDYSRTHIFIRGNPQNVNLFYEQAVDAQRVFLQIGAYYLSIRLKAKNMGKSGRGKCTCAMPYYHPLVCICGNCGNYVICNMHL